MRVKPTRSNLLLAMPRWIYGGGLISLLVALLFVLGIPDLSVQPAPVEHHQQTQVLIARKLIPSGSPLDEATLVFEGRVASELPEGAIRSLESIKGKISLAPISKGSIITTAQLGELIAIFPSQFEPEQVPPETSLEALMISPSPADTDLRASTTHQTK